ncbi:MAG: hypothetical protein WC624_06505 [Candidatus Margulisiibacteriota bacterium]
MKIGSNRTISLATTYITAALPPIDWHIGKYAQTTVETKNLNVIFYHSRAFGNLSKDYFAGTKKIIEKMENISGSLEELHAHCPFIPREVEVMLFEEPFIGDRKIPGRNMICIDMYHRDHINSMLHETGHIVFDKADSLPWRLIYCFALGDRSRFNLFKDSSFIPDWHQAEIAREQGWGFIDKPDPGRGPGHPWDNPNELFASAFHAYTAFPDELARRIQDPKTPKDAARAALLVFLYLRDEVFFGKTFFDQADPFKAYNFRSEIAKLKLEEITDSINNMDPEVDLLLNEQNSQKRGRGDLAQTADWLGRYQGLNVLQLCNRFGWRTFPAFLL